MSRKTDIENKRQHDIAIARCEELHAIFETGEIERREAELIKEQERLEYNNAEVRSIFGADLAPTDDFVNVNGRLMTKSMIESDKEYYDRYMSGEFAN